MADKTGLLADKDAISKYLGNATEYTLKKYIELGMPVKIEGRKWMAHKENIENFFKKYTSNPAINIPAAKEKG